MTGRLGFYFLLYTFLIFFGTPSLLLAMQTVAIAICVGSIFINRVSGRVPLLPSWFWMLLLSAALYIAFSMMRGMANAPTTGPIALRAAVNFLMTLIIPLIAYIYLRQGVLLPAMMLRHFTWAVLAFSVFKCGIVLAVAIFGIPIPILSLFFSDVFHTSPMFLPITPVLIRFGTASDYAVPFALYYCLSDPARGWASKLACSLLFAGCLFFSFSRFIWIMTVIALLMAYFSLPRKSAIIVLIGMVALSPLAFTLIDFTPVIERFSAGTTADSDSIRILQYRALSRDMDGYLLAGHGWASFRVDFVRDQTLPYSYEMQWLALLYQIGIVGILFVALLIGTVLLPYRNMSKTEWGVIILFLLSVLAGFTNPVLLGRPPGAIYAFVAFYGIESARRKTDGNRLPAEAV